MVQKKRLTKNSFYATLYEQEQQRFNNKLLETKSFVYSGFPPKIKAQILLLFHKKLNKN